jgi:hypothetical protein
MISKKSQKKLGPERRTVAQELRFFITFSRGLCVRLFFYFVGRSSVVIYMTTWGWGHSGEEGWEAAPWPVDFDGVTPERRAGRQRPGP